MFGYIDSQSLGIIEKNDILIDETPNIRNVSAFFLDLP